jgi:8-oxo-dGTP pyrophosphatase MutT (NUDIX family)
LLLKICSNLIFRFKGPGGKVEKSDSCIAAAAARECQEEVGLKPKFLSLVGVLEFYFEDNAKMNNRCHIFEVAENDWEGEVTETEEMKPAWFDINTIPYDSMWPDDKIWVPEILKGEQVNYQFYFKENQITNYSKGTATLASEEIIGRL